jgi:hypothetical protein
MGSAGLENDEVVLLKMQGGIRLDDEFSIGLAFQVLDAGMLFLKEQRRDAWMGTNNDLLLIRGAFQTPNVAEYFIHYAGRRFRVAPAIAVMAWFRHRPK